MRFFRLYKQVAFLVFAVAMLGWCLPGSSAAGDKMMEKGMEKDSKMMAMPDVVSAKIEGKNFCVGCSLAHQKGAMAQCSVLGHRHALKVMKAMDKEGMALPDMKGLVLHYLETDKSKMLITKHHGETVTLMGKIYPAERVFEVVSMEKMMK